MYCITIMPMPMYNFISTQNISYRKCIHFLLMWKIFRAINQ